MLYILFKLKSHLLTIMAASKDRRVLALWVNEYTIKSF